MKERNLLKNSIQQNMPDIDAVRSQCTDRSVPDNAASINKATNSKISKKRFIAIPLVSCMLVLFLTLLLFNKTGYHALPIASSSPSSLSDVSNGNSTSYASAIENSMSEESSPIDEGNTRYFTNTSSRKRPPYSTMNEFKAYVPFVFTGECISSKPVFQNNMLFTLSTVKVKQIIKGDIAVGDVVSIVEMFGRTTFGEYAKNCNIEKKSFETGAERLADDHKLVYGMDGFYTMKEGEEVLLFVGNASGFLKDFTGPLYSLIGDYDGKFFLQKDGSYAKPVPSQTDKLVFNEKSLRITINDLMAMK